MSEDTNGVSEMEEMDEQVERMEEGFTHADLMLWKGEISLLVNTEAAKAEWLLQVHRHTAKEDVELFTVDDVDLTKIFQSISLSMNNWPDGIKPVLYFEKLVDGVAPRFIHRTGETVGVHIVNTGFELVGNAEIDDVEYVMDNPMQEKVTLVFDEVPTITVKEQDDE